MSLSSHLPVNPSPNPNQHWSKQIPLTTLAGGSMLRWRRSPIPTGRKELKASGNVSMGNHMIREGIGDSEALQWVYWQAVVFRLPLAYIKLWGGGMPHMGLVDSSWQISYFILMPPATRDFQAMRQ